MTKNTDILSVKQELFTVVANGESGVSARVLARMSVLDQQKFVNV